MASTSVLKQMTKMTLRLAALAQLALLAATACDSGERSFDTVACSTAAQCPANQNCVNSVCTAPANGSAGNGNPGSAGSGNPGAAGSSAGASGATSNPGGGSGNSTAAAGGSSAGAGPIIGSAGAAGSNTTAGAGYWTSKDWHGCSWTGVGVDGISTVTPQDFTNKAAGTPFCVSGIVGKEPAYKSVALLGFNVNEPASASCVYKPVDTTAAGPAGVVPTADGVAINFVKQGGDTSFTLRVQIQGPEWLPGGHGGRRRSLVRNDHRSARQDLRALERVHSQLLGNYGRVERHAVRQAAHHRGGLRSPRQDPPIRRTTSV